MYHFKCTKCNIKILETAKKCPICGENFYVPAEIITEMQAYKAGLKLLSKFGEIIPMCTITTEDKKSYPYPLQSNEESVNYLVDIISSKYNIKSIMLLTEMRLNAEDIYYYPNPDEKIDGLCLIYISNEAIVKDIIHYYKTDSGIEFGDYLRTIISNKPEELGVFRPIYDAFIKSQNNEDNMEKISIGSLAVSYIKSTMTYVIEHWDESPDVSGASKNEVTGNILLNEAVYIFNNYDLFNDDDFPYTAEEYRDMASEIFIYLNIQRKWLGETLNRLVYFYLGYMNKYGVRVPINKQLAVEFFYRCIDKPNSKNGFISYKKGDDEPIVMILGNIDNFVEAAKRELKTL